MYRDAPTSTSLVQHGVAPALRGRCPFCAEVTARPGILPGTPCDVCGGVFTEDQRFGERVVSEMGGAHARALRHRARHRDARRRPRRQRALLGLVANLVALVVFRL
ncbi:MAG: hypothetical protein R3B99_05445 [Polyangiales bacterium]